jgi:hypothetical protein
MRMSRSGRTTKTFFIIPVLTGEAFINYRLIMIPVFANRENNRNNYPRNNYPPNGSSPDIGMRGSQTREDSGKKAEGRPGKYY